MQGGWVRSPDFVYWEKPLFEIEGKTLGIFGYGNIGSRVARIARAYGMQVVVCTRTPKAEIERPVDFDTLLRESDFVSLHAPLTDRTRELINRDSLSKMKPGAYLINTARGGLVNEADVRAALEEGSLAGYAADVVLQEPMASDCPLLGAPNCLLTPHIAWASVETRQRLLGVVVGNLKAWAEGRAVNVVS
jgi:glycerate dehydrogenase